MTNEAANRMPVMNAADRGPSPRPAAPSVAILRSPVYTYGKLELTGLKVDDRTWGTGK